MMEQFFLRVGDNLWVNPFPGNIVYAELTKDFDGNPVLDVHMAGDQRLRWPVQSTEAKLFKRWLDGESIDLQQKFKASNETPDSKSVKLEDEVAFPVKMLNVARNALSRIVRVDYGEEAVSIAKSAIDTMKSIEKEWADFSTPKN